MRTAGFLAALLFATPAILLGAPANDDCTKATVIKSFPFTDTVDMTDATIEPNEPATCGGTPARSVWYRIPAPAPQVLLRATIAGSVVLSGEMTFAEYMGSCGALTTHECLWGLNPAYDPELGIAPLGQDLLIRVGFDGQGGTLQLVIDQVPEFLLSYPGRPCPTVGGGHGFLAGFGKTAPTPSGHGLQLFDSTGMALGSPFLVADDFIVSEYTRIVGTGTGSFLVQWEGAQQTHLARIDPPDTVTPLPDVPTLSDVAADANGNFVVTWSGVQAQRFDANGAAQGAPFQVNTYTTGPAFRPRVAMAPDGRFVVVWTADDGDGDGVRARVFDASGTPIGDDFLVNEGTTSDQTEPIVGMDAAGNFVVSWFNRQYVGEFRNPAMLRRFAPTGVPLGGEFVVNTVAEYGAALRLLDLAVAPRGDFIIVWETDPGGSIEHPGAFTAVVGRRFADDGTPEGPQFFVNEQVRNYQYDPQVAASDDGSFMVVWEDFRNFFRDDLPDQSEHGVVARVLPAASRCARTPLEGCRQPTAPAKSSLHLVDDADPAHDTLRWTWPKGQATDVASFGDPAANDGYVLCLYDGTSARVFDAPIPAGGSCGTKPCWKGLGTPAGSTGYRYNDKERTPEGIQRLVLKAGLEGKAKIVVKGGGAHLGAGAIGLPALPLTLPARMQLQGPNGTCWESVFQASGVTTNDGAEFDGRAG